MLSSIVDSDLMLFVIRFGGGSVVVHAPSKLKVPGGGRERQLPSMALLTSSQHFLLRMLKVDILSEFDCFCLLFSL